MKNTVSFIRRSKNIFRLKTSFRLCSKRRVDWLGNLGYCLKVRELQRSTGAMIKIPEDPQAQGEEVLVEILGNFMQTSMAQTRIRTTHDLVEVRR